MSDQCASPLQPLQSIPQGPANIPTTPFTPVLPLPPSFTFQQIQSSNTAIQSQSNVIADLAKQVNDITKRYKIQFNIGTVEFYTNPVTDIKPEVTITGQSVTTPTLNFTLIPPKQGGVGNTGNMGSNGNSGYSGKPGIQGPQGYWGQSGNGYTLNYNQYP